MPSKKKSPATTLTAAEVREKIGDFQKEIAVEIPEALLYGEIADLSKRVKEFAKEKGIPGTLSIRKANIRKQDSYRSYNYRSGRYSYGFHTVPATCVVGSRPFTDEELEGADGKKVLAAMARAEKAKAKDVAKLKQLAAKHGIAVEV